MQQQHSVQNVSTVPGAGALQQQNSVQNVSAVPGAQTLQQTQSGVSLSLSGELSPTGPFTSVASEQSSLDSDTDTTQVETPQNPDHSDNTKAHRNVKIPDDVMQKFLQTIGTDYYSDLDEYSPGLQHTSDGYKYAPDLMGSD